MDLRGRRDDRQYSHRAVLRRHHGWARAFAGCLTGKHATRRQGLATYATPLKLLQVSFYIEHVVKPAAKRAAARSQAYVSIGSEMVQHEPVDRNRGALPK